jgi:hypothetical protein
VAYIKEEERAQGLANDSASSGGSPPSRGSDLASLRHSNYRNRAEVKLEPNEFDKFGMAAWHAKRTREVAGTGIKRIWALQTSGFRLHFPYVSDHSIHGLEARLVN